MPLKNKTEFNPITWPELGKLNIVDITVIFQTSGRSQMLASTLASFFKFNTYPLKKIVAIHDGKTYDELDKLIKLYSNITWIITNINVGQLAALDQIYKYIDTDYYFHSEEDWEYVRSGFIEYGIQAHEFDPKLNGLHITHRVNYESEFFLAGPLKIITELQAKRYSGLSFYPTVRRIKEYRLLEGGYTGASLNMSYGKGAGSCELLISKQYVMKGYHIASSRVEFALHTGA